MDTTNINTNSYGKQGDETLVNTETTNDQNNPSVAMLEDNKYVVVWQSKYQDENDGHGVYGQRYAADGTEEGDEFRVNTETTNDQKNPSVAHLGNGKFVVAWQSWNQVSGTSSDDIYAQRYAADGTEEGDEFRVNTHTNNEQRFPSVAGLDDGKFVVAWESNDQEDLIIKSWGSGYPSLNLDQAACQDAASRLGKNWAGTDNDYGPRGCAFSDIPNTLYYNTYPNSIECGDYGQDCVESAGYGIYAQRYASDGTTEGSEFHVNTETTGWQSSPFVAHLGSGKFVIAYTSNGGGTISNDIYAQRYYANGNKEGSEFRVNTHTTSAQNHPSVAALDNGKFVIAWSSFLQDNDSDNWGSYYGVYGQRYASDGTTEGSEFHVNTYTPKNQFSPSVAGLGNGKFVIVWQSDGQDGSYNGVYAQHYYANGDKQGDEFLVNTETTNSQSNPSVAGGADNKYVVVWYSENQDGSDDGVYAQRYGHPKEAKEGFNLCAQCDTGEVNIAGDFPSANALTTCDTCDIANSEANADNSFCVCKDGHSFDLTQCTACTAGTYRAGGDSVHGNATTCEACPAEHFSLEGSKECTAWSRCPAGEYLASPSATQDGTCTPCAAGSFQPDSDSIAQSCQACDYNTHSAEGASSCTPWAECTGETHYNGVRITGEEHCDANYVCSANSTEHTAPTSTTDRICACDAGHSFSTEKLEEIQVENEALVNTHTSNDQQYPTVAALEDGKYVVVWQSRNQVSGSSGTDIYGQRFNADGTTEGSEFLVNTYTTSYQSINLESVVAHLGNGKFVVVWNSYQQHSSSSGNDIYAQRFNADGMTEGSEFQVNTYTSADQYWPIVAHLGSGKFVVVWRSYNQASGSSSNDIYAQRFKADGTKDGSEFLVNTYTSGNQDYHTVAALDAGKFVVVWTSYQQHSSSSSEDIYAQRYAADGTKDGSEFLVNTHTSSGQWKPCVAHLGYGKFVVVWGSYQQDDVSNWNSGIYAQRYAADGTTEGSEFQVNTYTSDNQQDASVAHLGYGKFVVVWGSNNQASGSSAEDIYAQRFEADGTKDGTEFLVNTHTDGAQGLSSVAGLDANKFVVVWESHDQVSETSGDDIYQKLYRVASDHACYPCPIGTYRAGGDLSNNSATTCAPCAAGSFAEEAAAATCTPYTDANCDKGFELVTSAGNAPLLTEDASCSACVEGKWQPLDSTTNLCQPHTDLGCDGSTEVGDGTSSVDSAQCVCKGGHHFIRVITYPNVGFQTSGLPPNPLTVSFSECQAYATSIGADFYSDSWSWEPSGCLKWTNSGSVAYNTDTTSVSCATNKVCVIDLTVHIEPTCTACAAGFYRAKGDLVGGSETTCDACPAKTYSTGTAAECTEWTPCPAGSYNTIDSATQDSTCGVCPANTYIGTSNTLTACLAHISECPTGEQLKAGSGNTTHDKECEGCPAGTFQASASGAACATWRTTCDKGTQIENDGSASQDRSCSTCVAGKFQPIDATANACEDYRTSCPPGFALQDDGTTETDRTCQTCPEGTFKDDHGNHSCSLFKTTCPAGTQLVLNGNTEKDHDCQPCPKGTFQATESNETCALCEEGKEVTPLNALEGATGCVACVQKTHIDSDGVSHTACEALSGDKCPAGMGYLITDATKPNLCLPCPAGEFQASDDSDEACVAHTITTCPAGQQLKAGTASTDSVCEACPSGTYKAGSGAEACTPWLYEVCAIGYERVSEPSATQDGNCSACAAGYFNNGKNADACKAHRQICPAGFGLVAGTNEADATCQSCASGTFSAALDGGACVAHRTSCAAGEALGTDGSATKDHSCSPCISGTYNTDGTTCIEHTEASCPAGKGFVGSSTIDGSCSDCVDSYQPNAGSTAACKAWTVCDPTTEIETQAPSAVQDRICACAEGHRYDKPSKTCMACGGNLKRAAGDVKFVASSLI